MKYTDILIDAHMGYLVTELYKMEHLHHPIIDQVGLPAVIDDCFAYFIKLLERDEK